MKMIDKKLHRKVILDYRRSMDEKEYQWRNKQLANRVEKLILEGTYERVHVFLSISKNKEPDVTPIFRALREKGRSIVVSRTNFQSRIMTHFLLEEDTQLQENKLGIREPVGAASISFERVDLVLVPLMVADKMGNRIGYGGGFYDQLLQETNALKVGLSLSPPVDVINQKEEWDVPLNILITPFKIYQHG